MVNNLRVSAIVSINSSLIKAQFTDNLNPNIDISNILIESKTLNVPDPLILKVKISDNILEITTQPLTAFARYLITFKSTTSIQFKSLNGTSILFEDGVGNVQFFNGPIESNNLVKDYFKNYLHDNVYNTEPGTILGDYLDVLSSTISTSFYDAREVKSENYLSLTITDEKKVRGPGAFDHLEQEGAYEIVRVGRTKTDAIASMTLNINNFTTDPVSLLSTEYSENLKINSEDIEGFFNINSFILNLSKRFLIKINSIIFTYTNEHLPYIYDIEKYGYQILDSKYDSRYGFSYLNIKDNQIKLNDKILSDEDFSLDAIFEIEIEYNYKDFGRVIDQSTIEVNTNLYSTREVLPPLVNVFNLKYAPIVDSSGNPGVVGDIEFIDQNTLYELHNDHPAFQTELEFRLDYLPSQAGDYAVDYKTGTVYVFGEDYTKSGTGIIPPLVTYNYQLSFKEDIDWVADPDSGDLAAIPTGRLISTSADIDFKYESVLAKDIDYNPLIHTEILDERIDNRLLALNALSVNKSPITNVFRVFNETSGEIYKVTRWNDSKVVFSYNKPPNIDEILGERAEFELVSNEVMFVSDVTDLSNTKQIYHISLNNNNIISSSEDCIGASFNTTISLSDIETFVTELYFNPLYTSSVNLERLIDLGQYMIDYSNGVLYVVVQAQRDFDLGTISYKRGYIKPQYPHITSVSDLYYRINSLYAKEKSFSYREFEDNSILPSSFDYAAEQNLSGDESLPYLVFNNQIGIFQDTEFSNTISNNIRFLRGIYETEDLLNNKLPLNFSESATFEGKAISLSAIEYNEYHTVETDGYDYFIILNTPLYYLSSNIDMSISVVRITDSDELWDISGQVEYGSLVKLILSGVNAPQVGDSVLVNYSYSINALSHVVVDYNKGEYYIDYNALTDEIIISYEYGNNALDFRQSSALNENEEYYVTYKIGALRSGLFKNFGSLIDVGSLNNFDINYSRERYRDALTAAMHSFSKGPTVEALKNIGKQISHMPPQVNESAFESWSLGNSVLNQHQFESVGDFNNSIGKYGEGVTIDSPEQQLTLPLISNLRLEQGTFEAWISPKWDGLDNIADINIYIKKDGYNISNLEIFVGALEYHPELESELSTGKEYFSLNKNDRAIGTPNKNKDGVFIYYDKDISGIFNRWYVDVVDGYGNDGYSVDGYISKKYEITVTTNGKFYDTKPYIISNSNSRINSYTNKIDFVVNAIIPNDSITFLADIPHYILDFGEHKDKNRFSIFKDESGYLNFRVYDKFKNPYNISADVSSWKYGELHHIACSWKINTSMGRDEMHLFVDGFEVPNIMKYGDRIKPYLHEKYKTINPEEIISIIDKSIICGSDLTILSGSNQVIAGINFSQYGIEISDTIYIEEPGFNEVGYTISNVNGNTLTLASTMPFSVTNANFAVNKTSFDIKSEIDIFPNIAIAVVHSYLDGYDLAITSDSNIISSPSVNFITSGVLPGDLVKINTIDVAHYTVLEVSTNSLVINDLSSTTLSGLDFSLYHNEEEEIPGLRAIKPAYEISSDSYGAAIVTLRDKVEANDLVLIKTLGINHRKVHRKYFVWGNNNNVLKTKLPSPISLNNVMLNKIILNQTLIGPDNGSLSLGVFTSDALLTDQPTNSITGRSLNITINGTNIDFATNVIVSVTGTVVDGYGATSTLTENVEFEESGTLPTSNLFSEIDEVVVECKPLNSLKSCLVIEIKERFSLTFTENESSFIDPNDIPKAVIRYSYQVGVGNKLSSDGISATVTDSTKFFSDTLNNAYLMVYGPPVAAGIYKILGVSDDHGSLNIDQIIPSFSDGYYQILNVTKFKSGLQNGYFTFELESSPGTPYLLTEGLYELDYYTYLNIPFDLKTSNIFIGSDIEGRNQLYGSIDDMQILNIKLTDTRIGEVAASTQRTITKEYNSIKEPIGDSTNLVLAHFESIPFINEAPVYKFADKNIMQAGDAINDNFNQSISFTNKPLLIDNSGILDTKKQATIEFWVNPIFDTGNDPTYRFYFDASGAVTEYVTSTNGITIDLSGSTSEVISVKMAGSPQNIDYFAGGSISNNGKTLNLHKELPNQNTNVVVSYIPKGLNGDRVSIFKDPAGYINFNIRANGIDYMVRSPAFWSRNTWHRVKASYIVNSGNSTDEMHLFVDGYESANILFGNNLLFDQGVVYGSSYIGPNTAKYNIKLQDQINEFTIGGDINLGYISNCLMDNFRISNISRPIYEPFGEPIDPNYSSNLNMAFPITEDLNTTLLLNFNTLIERVNDFVILNDRNSGLADFSIKIFDSFDIINSNSKTKEVLEALIKSFKPASSRAFITYA